MISYELAKELKDAGFPQDGEGFRYCDECPEHEIHFLDHGLVYVLAPTLSELITACGDDFYSVRRNNDSKGAWVAHSMELLGAIHTLISTPIKTASGNGQYGETPEQAVANLYLSLHEAHAPEA